MLEWMLERFLPMPLWRFHDTSSPPPSTCRNALCAVSRKVFESAPLDTSPSAAPVIAYCNGGVASTVALFLLFQLRHLGRSTGDAAAAASAEDGEGGRGDGGGGVFEGGAWANYDGSWNEWGNDDSAPVER